MKTDFDLGEVLLKLEAEHGAMGATKFTVSLSINAGNVLVEKLQCSLLIKKESGQNLLCKNKPIRSGLWDWD